MDRSECEHERDGRQAKEGWIGREGRKGRALVQLRPCLVSSSIGQGTVGADAVASLKSGYDVASIQPEKRVLVLYEA